MENDNYIKTITETSERCKSNTHQIEEIKEEIKDMQKEQKAIYEIVTSIKVISSEMTNIKDGVSEVKESQEKLSVKMNSDIQELKDVQNKTNEKIVEIEQKPFKEYSKIKSNIVIGAFTAAGTALIIFLINLLLNSNFQV